MSRAPIRLFVLDDHEVVRHGLISILSDERDMNVVGEARTAEEALPQLRALEPDVTLVDLRLPAMSGAELIAAVRRERPRARFVVLTTFDADDDILQAFRAGAHAYVLKDSFRKEILAAVRAVHAGRVLVPTDIEARLQQRGAAAALTPRELEILRLVARGESNKRIAAALGIGESTIKTHLINVYTKLGVSDRTAAITTALARGLLRL